MIAQLLDHLWQSTLFALGAGLLTLPLRKNSAGVRYGLWFAASVKFLIPFALLAAAGGALASRLHITLVAPPNASGSGMDWAPQLMAPATRFEAAPAAGPGALAEPLAPAPNGLALHLDAAPLLLGAWSLGLLAILLVWALRWSRVAAALRGASPVQLPVPVPALSARTRMEPGVVGLWRPVLVLPEGIAERLSPAELEAVLAHELCHLRRKDNLTAAIHMGVQALFWFHPLVWWLGDRLVAERERACDEAVVRAGHDRETYARGIIETCRLYLHAPLACVAGASGSVLEQRVEEIITRPLAAPLALEAKASIGLAGLMALTIPVAAGILAAPQITQPLGDLVQAARAAIPTLTAPAVTAAPGTPTRTPRAAAKAETGQPVTAVEPVDTLPTVLARTQATVMPPNNPPADIVRSLNESSPPQASPAQAERLATTIPPPENAGSAPSERTASAGEIREQAYSFAQAFGATSARLDQLARWAQPVCVTVQGLAPDAAAKVAGRVQEVAGGVGVNTLPAGCKPNLQIVFTNRPQAFMDRVAVEHERLLGFWHHRDRDRLKAVTHPIQAWYVTGTGGGGGNTNGLAFAGGPMNAIATPARLPHGFQLDDEDYAGLGPTSCGDNFRFTGCLTSELQNVLVVVDGGKAQGAGLPAIADYVAMLAMAQPRSLDSCGALPSVIELFAKDCPAHAGQGGMTRADAAYLTALYKTDLEARKAVQQRDIADRMADLLIRANSARWASQDAAAGTARR